MSKTKYTITATPPNMPVWDALEHIWLEEEGSNKKVDLLKLLDSKDQTIKFESLEDLMERYD